MRSGKDWSRQELIVAFNLYCKLPFGQYHKNNEKVIALAKTIGRTPSAVALKLCNFARLDPLHQRRGVRGMQHGGKLEETIWHEFNQNWDELTYQSEVALVELKGQKELDLIEQFESELPPGKERKALAKVRINQSFFREMILASYRTRCAVCSLPQSELLVASHIVPWSVDASLRMNPRNGICMCVLHDKAFDKGLISITDDHRVLLSNTLRKLSSEVSMQRGFIVYEGNLITLSDRFIPGREFIRFHRENIFDG